MHLRLTSYEQSLIERLARNHLLEEQIEDTTEKCRSNLQSILQMLCNCNQFVDPRHWSRYDLLQEYMKMQNLNTWNGKYVLELEKWLTREVAYALRKKKIVADSNELNLRRQQAQEFRRRYKLQQNLQQRFI